MKKLKIATMFRRILLLVTIPFLVLSIVLFVYTLIRNFQDNCHYMMHDEQSVLSLVDDHVYSIQRETMGVVQSMDFLFFSNSSRQSVVTGSAERLLADLQNALSVYDEPVGAILYNCQLDRSFRFCFHTSKEDLDLLTEEEWVVPDAHRIERLLPVQTEQGLLLRYTIRERYGSLSVLIRPSDADSYRALCQGADTDPVFYTAALAPVGRSFLTAVSEKTPLALSYEIKSPLTFTGFNLFQLISILVLLALFVLVLVMLRFTQRTLLAPLLELSDAFQTVSEGDRSYRLGKTSKVEEIERFYTGFDTMLDSMRDAETEALRHQEEAQRAKLQYLQMQIRPHFYLNCLKTINFLAQIHEDEKIQSIVISLSDYFRYSFQDVNRLVTVREELQHVGSYIELCRSLYSEIRLELDVPEAAMGMLCIPLGILTFAENCIKHRVDENEILIRISAELSGEDADRKIIFRIQNSNCFSEEILNSLNAEPVNAFQYKSEKVGIANVRYRMWLLYREKFRLTFSNEDGLATVTLAFPVQVPPEQERRLL